ncbi:MAG: HAMP domain-containing protein [Ruminiclostridium sp.]|nr:HAMP domain-containing protein [Ruminiclostridium sp.]
MKLSFRNKIGLKNSFRIKFRSYLLLLSTSLTAFIMATMSIMFFIDTKSFINEKIDAMSKIQFQQIVSDINGNLNDIMGIAKYMQSSFQLVDMISQIKNNNSTAYKEYTLKKDITMFLTSVVRDNSLIKNINIIVDNDQYSSGNLDFDSDLVNSISSGISGKDIRFRIPEPLSDMKDLQPSTTKFIHTLDKETYFYFSLYDDKGGFLSNIYIFIQTDFLDKIIPDKSCLTILDRDSSLVFKGESFNKMNWENLKSNISDTNNNNSTIFADNNFTVYYGLIDFNKWGILFLVDRQPYIKQFVTLRNSIIIAFFLSIIISVIFSGLISIIVLRPVYNLRSMIRDYKAGNKAEKRNMENRCSTNSYINRLSLKEKVFYYLLVTILVPLLVFILMYTVYSGRAANTQIINMFNSSFQKEAGNVTEYILRKKEVLQRIVFSNALQNYFLKKQGADITGIGNVLRENILLGLDHDFISIYDINKKLLITNKFRTISNESDDIIVDTASKPFWSSGYDELDRHIITLTFPIKPISYSDGLENLGGYARIDIDYTFINEIYSELESGDCEIFIADRKTKTNIYTGNLLPENEPFIKNGSDSGFEYIKRNGSDYMSFYKRLGDTTWYLVANYDFSKIIKESNTIVTNRIYLFIIILLFIILLSYLISQNLLKPVMRLKSLINDFNISTMDKKALENYFVDEINDLAVSFNEMTARTESLIDDLIVANIRNSRMEVEKKASEIIALQAQINPHFLYNTLDNLIYLIENKMSIEAKNLVKSLSNLFRYGISRRDIIITIREEIQYAKAYIDIMKVRYGDKISFFWNIDKALLDFTTVKLILQPLIENSIYHGVRNKNGGGIIKVECVDKGENIQFIVNDNGKGLDEKVLENIRWNLSNNKNEDKIGIYNVQSRLRLNYGEKSGIEIYSNAGEGTTVMINMPKTRLATQ